MKTQTTNWDDIVSGEELRPIKKARSIAYEEMDCHTAEQDEWEDKGWEVVWTSKNGKRIKLHRPKSVGDAFEDRVWTMLARLGFTALNRSRKFTIWYGRNLHQQIDVFAVNEESIVFVECKASTERKPCNFKKAIESFAGQMEALSAVALSKYPNRKVKFIWAQSNYYLSEPDKRRLLEFGIEYFDDDTVSYYKDLTTHLGECARYQFFSALFKQQRITNFEERVPAIRSKLGQYTCYTFAIEPARLLQIGYILHHHSANDNLMPTYQRLIKKARLVEIRKFVEGGGYFANSLILSIDTQGRPLQFEVLPTKIPGSLSEVGVLHIPPYYCSAYVIDGQHRLYAYSGSELAQHHSIPVVAFENLDKHEQLQLFMDINENQKSVPKALRVTLNGDMLWTSNNLAERRLAIASKIAQELEDTKSSKLYGRIVVGENETQKNRRVTIAALQDALEKSGFLNKYSKDGKKLVEPGLLDFDDSKKTKNHIYDLLDLCFSHIYTHCPEAWEMTEEDATIVVTNRGIQAIIRLIADIVKYLKAAHHIEDPKTCEPEDYAQDIVNCLDPLCEYINKSTPATRKELRLIVGARGDTKFWREFQKVIHASLHSFNPEGLESYLQDETKQYNEPTKQNLQRIMEAVKEKVESNFFSKYSSVEEQLMTFPKNVYDRLNREVNDYKYQNQNKGENVDFKMFLSFSDLQALVSKAPYWNETFCGLFADPDVSKKSKKEKTAWMNELAELAKKMSNPGFSVSQKKADRVSKILEWLVSDE